MKLRRDPLGNVIVPLKVTVPGSALRLPARQALALLADLLDTFICDDCGLIHPQAGVERLIDAVEPMRHAILGAHPKKDPVN